MKFQTFAFGLAFIASITASAVAAPQPIFCPDICTRDENLNSIEACGADLKYVGESNSIRLFLADGNAEEVGLYTLWRANVASMKFQYQSFALILTFAFSLALSEAKFCSDICTDDEIPTARRIPVYPDNSEIKNGMY
ncbi:hypothetical protein BJ165DRAFT_1403355 [Panaeolus papilionaceus]|nr:hypothetical protein BJ165DRAFT_1403355 [Panaeolus papilionaceus]